MDELQKVRKIARLRNTLEGIDIAAAVLTKGTIDAIWDEIENIVKK